jgi:toxin ParE1/3/4
MRSYRLSPRAEKTLEGIIGWTIDHFGIEQAVKYKNRLIARLKSLAADELPHGRPCNQLLSGKLDVVDLEYYREGRHYIIYLNSTNGIFVLVFVHGSRDLEAILRDLSNAD